MKRLIAIAMCGMLALCSAAEAQVYGTQFGSAPSWNVYLGTSQTGLTSATRIVIAFDTAATTGGGNTNGFCDLTTNKGRCTPTVAGVYQVSCSAEITSGSLVSSGNEIGLLTLRKNSATTVADGDGIAELATLGSTNIVLNVSALISFNGTTDYTECLGYSDGTGNAVAFPAAQTRTRFYGIWVHS